jgi:flagella basal body P-ring formation protein FlgA
MPAPATPIVDAPIFQAPLIHAGDPLVVEEDTPVVEARLAATALGPAARGATLQARLSIGGKVVRVRALAAGRAALEPGLPPEPGAAP